MPQVQLLLRGRVNYRKKVATQTFATEVGDCAFGPCCAIRAAARKCILTEATRTDRKDEAQMHTDLRGCRTPMDATRRADRYAQWNTCFAPLGQSAPTQRKVLRSACGRCAPLYARAERSTQVLATIRSILQYCRDSVRASAQHCGTRARFAFHHASTDGTKDAASAAHPEVQYP